MTIYNRAQAVARALASKTNEPNGCQIWTRGIFGAPSVGDYDQDGRADAEDGWKAEPAKYKHPGDRHPPAGVPVTYLGGSHDDGHRAVSLGGGLIRSTDAAGSGHVATVPLDWPEKHWGLKYAGWSESCDGHLIPLAPPVKEKSVLAPKPAPYKAPKKSLAKWAVFIHLSAGVYQNYYAAITKAARKKSGAVDVDMHKSKQGTMWALHWGTVGGNHLHDPAGKIHASVKISSLTDAQIARLRGPKGQKPHKVTPLLERAARLGVRVELELKVGISEKKARRLLARPVIKQMNTRGLLQFKTLVSMPGSASRLGPVKRAGGTTILSFTSYRGKGAHKAHLWPVTDYVRGKAKWL